MGCGWRGNDAELLGYSAGNGVEVGDGGFEVLAVNHVIISKDRGGLLLAYEQVGVVVAIGNEIVYRIADLLQALASLQPIRWNAQCSPVRHLSDKVTPAALLVPANE